MIWCEAVHCDMLCGIVHSGALSGLQLSNGDKSINVS
jgi:hypothetical protein